MWTDFFTGRTYSGPSKQDVATTLDTMPVFVKVGGIVATRTDDVANDVQNPLTKVTLDVASGAAGHFDLYEDAGTGSDSAKTPIGYAETANGSTVTIGAHRDITVEKVDDLTVTRSAFLFI